MPGLEWYKLQAKLTLTGRYGVCLPPSPDDLSVCEMEARKHVKAVEQAWHRQTDYRANPPDPALLLHTLNILETLSADLHLLPDHSSCTLAAIMQTLVDGENSIIDELSGRATETGIHELEFSGSLEVEARKSACVSFVGRLMQQSSSALHDGKICRDTYSQHMLTGLFQHTMRILRQERTALPQDHCLQAAKHVEALIKSTDFATMYLGFGNRGDSNLSQDHQEQCTIALLQIRMMLRCERFFVRCSGAAHIAAFFTLARRAELHLQLFASIVHLKSIVE